MSTEASNHPSRPSHHHHHVHHHHSHNSEMEKKKIVCVTGSNGYLGSQIVYSLLELGHTVRACVRDGTNMSKIGHLKTFQPQTKLTIHTVPNILSTDGLDDAISGCDYVIHTASPVIFGGKVVDEEKEVIQPAIRGVKNTLEIALKHGVKRVVLTASMASMCGTQREKNPDHVYSDEDWNDEMGSAYSKSKTLAEKAGWDFIQKNPTLELVTIHPSLIIGPVLSKRITSTAGFVKNLFDGAFAKGSPPNKFGAVDIRDVSNAHILAMTSDIAKNQRYVMSLPDQYSMLKFGEIIATTMPLFKNRMPNKYAAGKEITLRAAGINSSKACNELGITLRPVEQSLKDFAKSLIEMGLITLPDQTTMSTIPSVTTSRQSVVVPLPLDDVWQLIRPGTFEWQTNLVAKTEKTGANRVISYKDKTQQTIQLTEISDRNYKLSWTMIISDPPVSYTSRDDTINLTSITALSQGIKAQTLIEWDSNFSNDVTIEVIMDSNLKKQDAFADLIDMSDTMEIDDSGPNSEIQIVTVLSRRSGLPRKSNFKVVSCNVPEVKDGEILVRSLNISVDPYLRLVLAALKVNDVPVSGTVAEIVESRAQDFKVGDKIFQYLPWRKLNALKPSGPMFRKVSADLEPSTALGVAGMPGFTAYVGLLKIGQLTKKDKTVFVSAAAGAVGTVVGQIAKIMGCRVIGTCGSAEKCTYLTEELGFDVALNYKTHGTSALMRKAISEKCPDGIDIYFDNTGGHTTEAVFDFLNKFARVPVCGQIAYYNATTQPMTEAFLLKTIYKCITIQGFVQNEYLQFHDDFLRDITEWIKNGKVKYRETVLDGFHKVPEAFIGLFSGKNIGKMVVSV